ncbi:FAD-dependent monooxygenase [Aquabacterium sp. OR-4]|uniref:FAD-dependent monooxygenase n=1 Tax=Aquabacterium sp. OR-4 TaxID=2978127 RepID=UPI0021B24BF9|nr:FAD-dependent monooxygenase [Aquabacterium sp. OR-4]MDT7836936.1 FAD-dependent monooxygenase [Aquabacterium sp. OR-4]
MSATDGQAPVLIAGAGIAGLCTALGLLRAGVPVRVFEQAAELREVGAAVSLAPNAVRALDSLGLAEALRDVANRPALAAMLHYRTGAELNAYAMGDEMERRWGKPYLQLLRADLHQLLVQAVQALKPDALVLGARVTGLAQDDAAVQLETAAGRFSGRALIGADGVRSAVRQALHGEGGPSFTGYVAWRGVVPMSELRYPDQQPDTAVYLGPQTSLLRYRVRGLDAMNVVAFARIDRWVDEGWSSPADPQELRDTFSGWHAVADDLFQAMARCGAFKWGLFGRAALPRWQVGRVSLIGDAAHPMLPFLGQGAAMAIEDGVLMARALAGVTDVGDALACYERLRYERATTTVRRSDAHGLRIHNHPVDAPDPGPVPRDDFAEFDFDVAGLPLAV